MIKKNKDMLVVFGIGVFSSFLFMVSFTYEHAIKNSLDELIWVVGGLGFVLFPVLFYCIYSMKHKECVKL